MSTINPNFPMSIKCSTVPAYAQYIQSFGRSVFEFSGDSTNPSFISNVTNLNTMLTELTAIINEISAAVPPINR